MAAWTYSAWRSQSTTAAQLSMLRLHMAEVADKISNERGADSFNVGSQSVTEYYKALVSDEKRLSSSAGAARNGGFSVARLVRGRDAR